MRHTKNAPLVENIMKSTLAIAFSGTLLLPLSVGYSLDPNTATVTGTVGFTDGRTSKGMRVSLVNHGFAYTVPADQNGRFIFFSVPSGPYLVVGTVQGGETCYPQSTIVEAGNLYDINVSVNSSCK